MNIDLMQLEFIDLDLRKICVEAEDDIGIEFKITSLFRMNDRGVHGVLPLRGVDFRMRVYSVGKAIEEHINSKWIYDDDRPEMKVAYLHDVGSGLHLHIQSHPNTKRR